MYSVQGSCSLCTTSVIHIPLDTHTRTGCEDFHAALTQAVPAGSKRAYGLGQYDTAEEAGATASDVEEGGFSLADPI